MLAPSEAQVNGNRFRQKRLSRFLSIVDEIVAARGSCRILDVGGKLAYWQALYPLWSGRPCHITLVNLESEAVPDGRFTSVAGDARDLGQFDDLAFDLVHSNSVIGARRSLVRPTQNGAGGAAGRAALLRANAEFLVSGGTAFPHAVYPLAAGTVAGGDRHAPGVRLLSSCAILLMRPDTSSTMRA